MKILRIIFLVLKNFFPVVFSEIRQFLRSHRLFRRLLIFFLLAIVAGGGVWAWKHMQLSALERGAGWGKPETYKVVVEILTPDKIMDEEGPSYQRGEIRDIKDSEHNFSPAEKARYAIIKMELTKKQAKELGFGKKDGEEFRSDYAVDLTKIGMSDNDYRGRETEAVYEWKIIYNKDK